MSHDTAAGVRMEDAFVLLLRRCLYVVVPLGVICAVLSGFLWGGSGVLSGAIGSLIVVLFFGARLVVMRQMATRKPELVLVTALAVYTGKVVLLGIAMLVLTRVSWIEGRPLGLSVLLCAMVWLAVEMLTTMKLRLPIFGQSAPDGADLHDTKQGR